MQFLRRELFEEQTAVGITRLEGGPEVVEVALGEDCVTDHQQVCTGVLSLLDARQERIPRAALLLLQDVGDIEIREINGLQEVGNWGGGPAVDDDDPTEARRREALQVADQYRPAIDGHQWLGEPVGEGP